MLESQPDAIIAWQQGDEQAVRLVFDTYYPRAVRFAILSRLSIEATQDCVQEAFVHTFSRLNKGQLLGIVNEHVSHVMVCHQV